MKCGIEILTTLPLAKQLNYDGISMNISFLWGMPRSQNDTLLNGYMCRITCPMSSGQTKKGIITMGQTEVETNWTTLIPLELDTD